MELKLKLVTTSPGGWWWVGGWTKTKLMLFSTLVEVVVELKLELSLAIITNNAQLRDIMSLKKQFMIMFYQAQINLVLGRNLERHNQEDQQPVRTQPGKTRAGRNISSVKRIILTHVPCPSSHVLTSDNF